MLQLIILLLLQNPARGSNRQVKLGAPHKALPHFSCAVCVIKSPDTYKGDTFK